MLLVKQYYLINRTEHHCAEGNKRECMTFKIISCGLALPLYPLLAAHSYPQQSGVAYTLFEVTAVVLAHGAPTTLIKVNFKDLHKI